MSTHHNQFGRSGRPGRVPRWPVQPAIMLLAIFGALLPAMHYFVVAGALTNVSAADVVLLPVLLLSLPHLARTRGLAWWLAALLLANLASWVLSAPIMTARTVIVGLMRLAVCFLYGFAGFAAVGTRRREVALLVGMLVSAVPIAAISVYAYFTGRPASFLMEGRAQGTFTDPNAFACYLALVIALTASLPAALFAAPILAAGGLASLSRTGIVSLGCALALVLRGERRRRLLAAGIIAASLLGFLVFWHFIRGGFGGERVLHYETTLERRVELWTLAREVGMAHLLLGVGKGNWALVTRQRALPHNTFLTLLADTGLVGLAVFLVPLLWWLYRGMHAPRSAKWANAAAICLIGGLGLGLENFRPFWVAAGALCGVLQAEAARQRRRRLLRPEPAGSRPQWGRREAPSGAWRGAATRTPSTEG